MKFKIGENRISGIQSFDKILPDIINKFELEKLFTIEGLISKWSEIVGDIISTHSKPDRIFNNILFVSVDHSTFANSIIMMKDAIISRINDEFSYTFVKSIRTEIKNIKW